VEKNRRGPGDLGHLEPQGRRLPVNKHGVATEIILNRGGEIKFKIFYIHKKRQYESVANVEMKNAKMKFILAFFILPDDKKRPVSDERSQK
jgi:hypothetical protein